MYQAAGSSGSGSPLFLIIIVVLGGGYLLFIRSVQRKQRAKAADAQSMRDSLGIGAEIVTIGGLYGTVVGGDDDSVTLEISDGVTARYDRNAVARVITPAEVSSFDEDDEDSADADETDRTDLDVTANSIIEQKD